MTSTLTIMAAVFLAASPALAVDRSKELSEEERAALAITAVETALVRIESRPVETATLIRFDLFALKPVPVPELDAIALDLDPVREIGSGFVISPALVAMRWQTLMVDSRFDENQFFSLLAIKRVLPGFTSFSPESYFGGRLREIQAEAREQGMTPEIQDRIDRLYGEALEATSRSSTP